MRVNTNGLLPTADGLGFVSRTFSHALSGSSSGDLRFEAFALSGLQIE